MENNGEDYGCDVGLKLPNGEEVWPPSEYKGFSLKTGEDRGKLVMALINTESDLNLKPGTFVEQHSWITREWKITGNLPISDTIIAPLPSPEGATDGQ